MTQRKPTNDWVEHKAIVLQAFQTNFEITYRDFKIVPNFDFNVNFAETRFQHACWRARAKVQPVDFYKETNLIILIHIHASPLQEGKIGTAIGISEWFPDFDITV